MKIIMLGAPGAGKGTQAKQIAAKYQIPHISTGDIFRANIKGGTELGMKAKSYMDQGQLVPDELTVRILLDRVAKDDCKNGYVLDGFPRTIPQAEVLDKALSEINDKIDYAINVDVPDENIINRIFSYCRAYRGIDYAFRDLDPEFSPVCPFFLMSEVIFIDRKHSIFLKIMKCRSCLQRVTGVLVHLDMRNWGISGSDEAL